LEAVKMKLFETAKKNWQKEWRRRKMLHRNIF
jgi:hypothetical protein